MPGSSGQLRTFFCTRHVNLCFGIQCSTVKYQVVVWSCWHFSPPPSRVSRCYHPIAIHICITRHSTTRSSKPAVSDLGTPRHRVFRKTLDNCHTQNRSIVHAGPYACCVFVCLVEDPGSTSNIKHPCLSLSSTNPLPLTTGSFRQCGKVRFLTCGGDLFKSSDVFLCTHDWDDQYVCCKAYLYSIPHNRGVHPGRLHTWSLSPSDLAHRSCATIRYLHIQVQVNSFG